MLNVLLFIKQKERGGHVIIFYSKIESPFHLAISRIIDEIRTQNKAEFVLRLSEYIFSLI